MVEINCYFNLNDVMMHHSAFKVGQLYSSPSTSYCKYRSTIEMFDYFLPSVPLLELECANCLCLAK